MAEVITEQHPRVKFTTRVGPPLGAPPAPVEAALLELAALQHRLEQAGVIPVLADGLVGGNCALAAPGGVMVSRTGKPPATALRPDADFVFLAAFDRNAWAANCQPPTAAPAARPSSDAPLHWAALAPGAAARYGWAAAPAAAVHGHALAEGAGLAAARRARLPVSERETLFSTPDDLEALEALFRAHPYPAHRVFIRRGHGFLVLAPSPAEAASLCEALVLPLHAAAAGESASAAASSRP